LSPATTMRPCIGGYRYLENKRLNRLAIPDGGGGS
jgi:hypothetical protein